MCLHSRAPIPNLGLSLDKRVSQSLTVPFIVFLWMGEIDGGEWGRGGVVFFL